MGPFTIGAGLRGERVTVNIARRFSKRHIPSSHISMKTREASQCDESQLAADVHEPVAVIEVRTVRDHDQLRSVDAGTAAVLRMQVHREAGAIGRLNGGRILQSSPWGQSRRPHLANLWVPFRHEDPVGHPLSVARPAAAACILSDSDMRQWDAWFIVGGGKVPCANSAGYGPLGLVLQ
jgi:hypothetical protein